MAAILYKERWVNSSTNAFYDIPIPMHPRSITFYVTPAGKRQIWIYSKMVFLNGLI